MSRPTIMPNWIDCPKCRGTGQLVESKRPQPGAMLVPTLCPECKGEGKVPPKG